MPLKKLKLMIAVLSCGGFILFGFSGSHVGANSTGPPSSHTGAPGEMTCATTGCHSSSPVNSGNGTLALTGLPANYSSNQEIQLTVTLSQANRQLYGFQLTAIDDAGKQAGDLIVTDSARTQKSSGEVDGNQREYISHTFDGTVPSTVGQLSWTFRWKAPAQDAGRVRFFVAGNAANASGDASGDFIYTTSASIQPDGSPASMSNVSAASFAASGALSGEAIAAAFSTNMATGTVVATTLPLPTELDGTRVIVSDAMGEERTAQLFFVSPSQVNYLVPQGTASGTATVSVRRGGSDIAQGAMTVERVAPGLFSASATGRGVAAAVVLRVNASGRQTFEPVARFNSQTNRFEAVPIDLGPETDQVFLIAFGTGFRNRSALSAVICIIGGANAETLFAGASPDFVGLDQANIRIPRNLAGRGDVDVVFRTDNRTANTVTFNIK